MVAEGSFQPVLKLCAETGESKELVVYLVEQLRKVFVLEVLALGVEVKPLVADALIFQCLNQLCELLANSVLASFFVNQIN